MTYDEWYVQSGRQLDVRMGSDDFRRATFEAGYRAAYGDFAVARDLADAVRSAPASPPSGSEPRDEIPRAASTGESCRACGAEQYAGGHGCCGDDCTLCCAPPSLPDRIRTFVAAHESDGGAAWLRYTLRADLGALERALQKAANPHPNPTYVEARALLTAAYEETASRCRVLIEAAKAPT